MNTKFHIEDKTHAEIGEEYDSFENALKEIKELSKLSWEDERIRPPCTNWKTCELELVIGEWNNSVLVKSTPIVTISAKGCDWKYSENLISPAIF